MNQKILSYALRFLIGGFFIFSGVAKLLPVESFELALVETGVIPWAFSDWAARFIIVVEVFLGLGLLINSRWLPRIIRSTILLTIFFSIYLVILWYNKGADVDCGCLGERLTFTLTPPESLIKNALIILGLTFTLFRVPSFNRKFNLVFFGLMALSISVPFVLNPIQFGRAIPGEETFPFKLELEKFPTDVIADMKVNPYEDSYLLAFMSTKCGHCRVAARKLKLASNNLNLPKTHILLVGPRDEYPSFQKESGSEFEYTFFGDNAFFQFCNGILPTLLYIEKGQVMNKWQGSDINHSALSWSENRYSLKLKD